MLATATGGRQRNECGRKGLAARALILFQTSLKFAAGPEQPGRALRAAGRAHVCPVLCWVMVMVMAVWRRIACSARHGVVLFSSSSPVPNDAVRRPGPQGSSCWLPFFFCCCCRLIAADGLLCLTRRRLGTLRQRGAAAVQSARPAGQHRSRWPARPTRTAACLAGPDGRTVAAHGRPAPPCERGCSRAAPGPLQGCAARLNLAAPAPGRSRGSVE